MIVPQLCYCKEEVLLKNIVLKNFDPTYVHAYVLVNLEMHIMQSSNMLFKDIGMDILSNEVQS